MRYNTFTVVNPAGKVERMRVPTMFSPFDIAEKLPHHLVFLHVTRGSVHAYAGKDLREVSGPDGVVFVGDSGPGTSVDLHYVPKAPATDAEAYHLWRDWVGPVEKRGEVFA